VTRKEEHREYWEQLIRNLGLGQETECPLLRLSFGSAPRQSRLSGQQKRWDGIPTSRETASITWWYSWWEVVPSQQLWTWTPHCREAEQEQKRLQIP
jgi:hypothetical protein